MIGAVCDWVGVMTCQLLCTYMGTICFMMAWVQASGRLVCVACKQALEEGNFYAFGCTVLTLPYKNVWDVSSDS